MRTNFIDENKSWSVLLTMCIGCKQDDINFPDVDSQLYKEHKNRNKVIPTTANTMRKEVIHRSIILNPQKVARPAGWTKKNALNIKKKNHTFSKGDVSFLIRKEAEMHTLLKNSEKEIIEQEKNRKISENWIGEMPYLRLYSCVVHDSVRPSYL